MDRVVVLHDCPTEIGARYYFSLIVGLIDESTLFFKLAVIASQFLKLCKCLFCLTTETVYDYFLCILFYLPLLFLIELAGVGVLEDFTI
jgi:hypothetical protein